MKAGRILIIVCLALAVVAVTAGAQKKVTIGISMPFVEDSPYFFPYTQAVKKEAAARGWDLIMTDAKTDLNTQVNQIEDLVSKGLDGLMVVPLDAAGIVPVIDKMYAQTKGKLPIITSNVMTDPPQLKSLKGFAGPNSYLEGKAMGEYYVNYFKKKGLSKVYYCEATGTAGYSASRHCFTAQRRLFATTMSDLRRPLTISAGAPGCFARTRCRFGSSCGA